MLDKKKKQQIIKKFAAHENDTGSAEVQIALLTEEIKNLTEHLKEHKKDFSSRRGLLKKVAERRKLLKYFQRENPEGFKELVKKLKLKGFQQAESEKSPEDLEERLENAVEANQENNSSTTEKSDKKNQE